MTTAREKGKWFGFLGGACTLFAVYAAASSPIPLFNIYQSMIAMSNGDLALTAVFYFVGTLVSLLMFARISNYIGRKKSVIIALLLSAAGCGVFAAVNNVPMFMLGRFLQGMSCGLASSCAAAYVVDTAPRTPAWLGAVIVSSAPMVGLAAGAFGAGAVAQYGGGQLAVIDAVLIGVDVLCLFLILAGKETVAPCKGVVRSLRPQIKVPHSIRPLLLGASAAFAGTWAIGGFFQAYSATMATEQFGTTNTLIAAAIFASLMAPNVIGSTLAGKMNEKTAQRTGMTVFACCVMVIIATLGLGLVVPFLIACVLGGAAIGMAFSGAMRSILDKTTAEERAGVLSTIYLISYSGAAIPNLIVGRISGMFSLLQIATGYGVLVLIALVLTWTVGIAPRSGRATSRALESDSATDFS